MEKERRFLQATLKPYWLTPNPFFLITLVCPRGATHLIGCLSGAGYSGPEVSLFPDRWLLGNGCWVWRYGEQTSCNGWLCVTMPQCVCACVYGRQSFCGDCVCFCAFTMLVSFQNNSHWTAHVSIKWCMCVSVCVCGYVCVIASCRQRSVITVITKPWA